LVNIANPASATTATLGTAGAAAVLVVLVLVTSKVLVEQSARQQFAVAGFKRHSHGLK